MYNHFWCITPGTSLASKYCNLQCQSCAGFYACKFILEEALYVSLSFIIWSVSLAHATMFLLSVKECYRCFSTLFSMLLCCMNSSIFAGSLLLARSVESRPPRLCKASEKRWRWSPRIDIILKFQAIFISSWLPLFNLLKPIIVFPFTRCSLEESSRCAFMYFCNTNLRQFNKRWSLHRS